MLECVANVAEGRDSRLLETLAAACGPALLDLHADHDHHSSVFTLAGPGDRDAAEAAADLATAVAAHLDLRTHRGVHPRLGALDVVPFVALGEPDPVALDAARTFGAWLAESLAVPVFFYDDADPGHRSLPELRRAAFAGRAPDLGPTARHARLGASAVGARAPLVAVNPSGRAGI